jgi:hypothetical protein
MAATSDLTEVVNAANKLKSSIVYGKMSQSCDSYLIAGASRTTAMLHLSMFDTNCKKYLKLILGKEENVGKSRNKLFELIVRSFGM